MIQFRKITLYLVYFLNVFLLFLLIFEDKVQLPTFLQVAGRMHPLVLHFPIALLFLGIFIEWFMGRKQPGNATFHELTSVIFNLLALGAALTALFGFFLYKEGSYQGEEVIWHKWTGTLVSLLAGLLVWLKKKPSAFYRPTLVVSAVAITLTGHLGAEITHGKGFLTEPFRKQSQTRAITIENADSAMVFRDVIQPILNEKCSSCHNTNKAKNDLILTDYQFVVKGGKNKDGLVPGKADKSLLYKYALLPMDDSLHMPPQGKHQLEKEEIALIGWWINTGAKADQQYATLPKVDSIHPIMLSLFQPKKGLDSLRIAFADPTQIKELNTPYRTVQQLSAIKPYVAVFLGSKNNFTSQDLEELKGIREQVVSIDLGNSKVKDQDLKPLNQFPHLQKLHLQNNAISDEGIRQLAGLSFLESINLSGTRITAKTLDELAGWKHLKKIFLYNTTVSEEYLATWKKSNPSLQVFNTQINLNDTLYNAQLRKPECKIDSSLFSRSATVEVKLSRGKVRYYYTLDGSEPTPKTTPYTSPFQVAKSAQLKILATMVGWKDSPVANYPLMKLGVKPDQALLETKPDAKHKGKLDSTLVDGKSGSLDQNDKEYLGFLGHDFRVDFKFVKARLLSQLALSYLEDVQAGIMPPEQVEVWGGTDKNNLKKLGLLKVDLPQQQRAASKQMLLFTFSEQPITHVRLVAKNMRILPPWHTLRKTSKAWLFIDEVAME